MANAPRIWRDGARDTNVPLDEAVEAWTTAAIEILERVASRYGAAITDGELDAKVQDRSRVHTAMRSRDVISRVAERLVRRAADDGAAPLAALIVRPDGNAGAGYRGAVQASFETDEERQHAAAVERLACYRVFASDVPADATPRPTALRRERDAGAERAEARRAAKVVPQRESPVCPNCYVQTRADGTCESCS